MKKENWSRIVWIILFSVLLYCGVLLKRINYFGFFIFVVLVCGVLIMFLLYFMLTFLKLKTLIKLLLAGFLTPLVYNLFFVSLITGNNTLIYYPRAFVDSVLLALLVLLFYLILSAFDKRGGGV